MTSEIESLKTNEFLRRRKLRLQQVREQSKDIAKKIRQRANVENLRQNVDLEAKKQKEYFEKQEKLVKRLEVLYARGLENVGASHRSATELRRQEKQPTVDLSKSRAREAVTELRRQKQQKLDEQKRLLDRKLQAREAANEISREKSTVVTNKLLTKPSAAKDTIQIPSDSIPDAVTKESDGKIDQRNDGNLPTVTTTDMATQWDLEEQPNEWESAVPTLPLTKDDRDSGKESDNNIADSKSDKSRRLDLFALSKEMPSSLRGGNIHIPDERVPVKPSLTLVSEYLQSRGLRLREPETCTSSKKPNEDLHGLKQTIQRTRASKPEGRLCHVHDGQVIPMPSWQAEADCQHCYHGALKHTVQSKQFSSVTNSQINKIFSSIRPVQQELLPSPVLRGSSPFRRNKVSEQIFSCKARGNTEKSRSNSQDSCLSRKNSVTMYNHSTRNTQDVICNDNKLVVRDLQNEDDAYSQAMRESSVDNGRDQEHHRRVQDMRNKVAMTKRNVEKEYKDTINFLKSIPKEKCSNAMKTAYMDDRRQQTLKDNRQRKLQQEYRKIEKECTKHKHCNKSKSKSPTKVSIDNELENRDTQYSWMPVPEHDANLAIHTIPTTVKEGKSSNTVKFSKVDSYHEYRSRHRHTPPTKDTDQDKARNKKVIEADISEKSSSDTIDSSSISSDTSSVENMDIETRNKKKKKQHRSELDQSMSDAERIIIYKILDTRSDKKSKKGKKIVSDIAKSLTSIQRSQKANDQFDIEHSNKQIPKNTSKETENRVSFEQLNEGVYKMTNEKGNNITSMYFTDNQMDVNVKGGDELQNSESYSCKKTAKENRFTGNNPNWECGDDLQARISNATCNTANTSKHRDKETTIIPPSATPGTSAASFKTVVSEKPDTLSDDGFIRLVNEAGQEAGKFYIGATGFFKDDAYEMVIQLRKKGAKDDNVAENTEMRDFDSKSKNKVVEPAMSMNEKQKTVDGDVHNIVTDTNPADAVLEKVPSLKICDDVPDTNIEIKEKTKQQNIERHNQDIVEVNNDAHIDNSATNKDKFVDKGVGTSFQLSYLTPSNLPKEDPVPRPATSTCTQTTLSPPNHRPVLLHMSSSTSTAYMSPPEMVLPKFLRRDFYLSEDEVRYEPVQKVEITKKQPNCKKYHCNCNRCRHARTCYKKSEKIETFNTPPNTARSCSSEHRRDRRSQIHRIDIDASTTSHITDKAKCKCRKCLSGVQSRTSITPESHKNKCYTVGYKRTSRNINTHATTTNMSRNKHILSGYTKKDNSNLNPLVKNYVNRLLDLNKEGLKVIEVADQECSSVATPGSSIINVPCNVDERKGHLEKTISLQQIKNILKEQIIEEQIKHIESKDTSVNIGNPKKNLLKLSMPRKPRLKPVHKVKSLNISKHLLKTKRSEEVKKATKPPVSASTTDDNIKILQIPVQNKSKCWSKSSPTPRPVCASESALRFTDSDITTAKQSKRIDKPSNGRINANNKYTVIRSKHATITSSSLDSESIDISHKYKNDIPMSMSTQTSQNVDSEVSFMRMAEDKLHNMEKIADLTEKCTQRLSNLAKVLEEVRKNKSTAYSRISTSDTTSDSDQKSDKALATPLPDEFIDDGIKIPVTNLHKEDTANEPEISKVDAHSEYVSPFSMDISQPDALEVPNSNILQSSKSIEKTIIPMDTNFPSEVYYKCRPKPPPALSRINLKHGQEPIIPHELSTVLEVDSPMSVKHRNQSSRNELKNDALDNVSRSSNEEDENQDSEIQKSKEHKSLEANVNPDILQSNVDFMKQWSKSSSTELSDDSKFQMIDLKHFNKIMLEPFISIQDYAKQYNVETLDEGSNVDEVQKEDVSSLHSDGSLPDVIAELLKRNIITEPFKFDTASNMNSTTISSESTLSVLALSKVRKDRKKSNVMFHNKENIAETSDSLSISSNPDLENAFKKLGMGWASSTLKKTKERLALSSSSNTSSSSLSQFKIKSFNHDIPALVTDSVSSVINSKKQAKAANEISKNAEQQTSLINSMTVKEFLTNELAKKITFTNKSNRNDTEEEFVSLFETKMPEEIKEEQYSVGSMPSAGNNRARTSTPVQIFKSMTYHSSSSSNVSNGLFSNADDLSSVKMTSNSLKNHSTSEKDDLTVPNLSLRIKKGSDCSKSE